MRIIEGFRLRNVMGQATIVGEGVGQIDFNKLITLNESAAYLWQSVEGKDFDIATLATHHSTQLGALKACVEIAYLHFEAAFLTL